MQSFHGRSFTGNHCTKYLKDTVFSDICSTPVKISQKPVDDPEIHQEACIIQQIFDELNQNFSAVHKQISHDLPIQSASVSHTENSTDSYMKLFNKTSLTSKVSQSSTSWKNIASTGLAPGGLVFRWWGSKKVNSCTQASAHWSDEHGPLRKKINNYSSICINITLRSLQHSGSTGQPAVLN